MKKYILTSIILIYSVIFKSLATGEKSYKILQREGPAKHFTLNKNNLKEIFDSEPTNVNVQLELPYFNKIENFELEKLQIYNPNSFTFTSDGHYFRTKMYDGLSYVIKDSDGTNHGVLNLYPDEARLNLTYEGKNIKIETDYDNLNSRNGNVPVTRVESFDIQKTKLKTQFNNVKDLVLNFDKTTGKKYTSKIDSLKAEKIKKEITKYIKEKETDDQKTFKPFKESEILKSENSANALFSPPPPPPSEEDCQKITLHYVIGYDTYLKWQKPKLFKDNQNSAWMNENSIKYDFDSAAVANVKKRLTDYLSFVISVYAEEGIRLEIGVIEVFTFSWKDPRINSNAFNGLYTKYHANQFLEVSEQWRHNNTNKTKFIPLYTGKNAAGKFEFNAYGSLLTNGEMKTSGLYNLVLEKLSGGTTRYPIHSDPAYRDSVLVPLDNWNHEKLMSAGHSYTQTITAEGDTVELPRHTLSGLHFWIGDREPAVKNYNPIFSEFSMSEWERGFISRYTNDEPIEWAIEPGNFGAFSEGNVILQGNFNNRNFLPMMSNLQEGGTPWFNGNLRSGCHAKDIGATVPTMSTPTGIYGYRNSHRFNETIGFIPLLGSKEYHTYDYEFQIPNNYDSTPKPGIPLGIMNEKNYIKNYRITDTSMTKWNLKDHDKLYGEPEEYGDTDYATFDIDKWNKWMLIHNIAVALGARYFATKDNRNTILAPVTGNYNYDADNYRLYNLGKINQGPWVDVFRYPVESTPFRTITIPAGTPHISAAFPSYTYDLEPANWFEWWFSTFIRTTVFKWIYRNMIYSIVAGAAGGYAAGALTQNIINVNAANIPMNQQYAQTAKYTHSMLFYNNGGATGYVKAIGVGAKILAIAILVVTVGHLLIKGYQTGYSLQCATKGDNPAYPQVYSTFDFSSGGSGCDDLPNELKFREQRYGINPTRWDVRYSWLDLNTYFGSISPVDLVSFSKGFDKKTGDLIRLNLTSDYVTGDGYGAKKLLQQSNIRFGLFDGTKPNPYAKILTNNIYYVEGDSINPNSSNDAAKIKTDSINIMKKNSLINAAKGGETEADNLVEPDLKAYYGSGMKPHRFKTLYNDVDQEGPPETLTFDWELNNVSIGSSLQPKVKLVSPDVNRLQIIPITLKTTTNLSGCQSNTAKKYLRVYPKLRTPIIDTFGINRWYSDENSNASTAYLNWEFIGPWSVGEGPSEARIWPNSQSTKGFYNRGSAPWSGRYISNTGWSRSQNVLNPLTLNRGTYLLTYIPVRKKSVWTNPGQLLDNTQFFMGEKLNISPKSPLKNWYSSERLMGQYNTKNIIDRGPLYRDYITVDFKPWWHFTLQQGAALGYERVTNYRANVMRPQDYCCGGGWYKWDWYINRTLDRFRTINTETFPPYPDDCSLAYWRHETADTARTPLYTNDFRVDNNLTFSFTYAYLFVDTAQILYPPSWPNPNNNLYSIKNNIIPDTLEIWAKFIRDDGTVNKVRIFKKGGRQLNTVNGLVRVGNPANLSNIRPGYTNNLGASFQPAYKYAGVERGFELSLNPIIKAKQDVNGLIWKKEIFPLNGFDGLAKYVQFDIIYKNRTPYFSTFIGPSLGPSGSDFGRQHNCASNLYIDNIEVQSGDSIAPVNPLPLCQGGTPILQFYDRQLNSQLIFNQSGNAVPYYTPIQIDEQQGGRTSVKWRLLSNEKNNATHYKVWLVKNGNPPTKQLIKEGPVPARIMTNPNAPQSSPTESVPKTLVYNSVNGTLAYTPPNLTNADSTRSWPGGLNNPPRLIGDAPYNLIASDTLPTKPETSYTIVAALFNKEKITVNNQVYSVTDVDSVLSNQAAMFQKQLGMKLLPDGTQMYVDSIFNTDRNFRITAQFYNPNISIGLNTLVPQNKPCGIERAVLQRYVPSSEAWQNVPSGAIINSAGPLSPLPNPNPLGWNLTNIQNGVYRYRIAFHSKLAKPSTQFSPEFNVTVCYGCGLMKAPEILVNSDSRPQLTYALNENQNVGTYYLYSRLLPQHNIKTLRLFELRSSNGTLQQIKQRTINSNNSLTFIDTIVKTQANINNEVFTYYLHGINTNLPSTANLVWSNRAIAIPSPQGCAPLPIDSNASFVDNDQFLNFKLNPLCSNNEYSVRLFKLLNKTNSQGQVIYDSSDPTLGESEVVQLPSSTTEIIRFGQSIEFTPGEIFNGRFKRYITNPNETNYWYRIEMRCKTCLSNNLNTTFYYFRP